MGRSNGEPMQLLFPGLSSSANLHDRFEIGKELGRGGGGVVHSCHSLVTGRPIAACKSIPKYKLQRREVLMELRNEVDTMLKLRGHPHIVELQGLYEDAGAVHLIMDLCEGGDLYEYLASNVTLPEKVAAMVVRQVLLALRHCHENGVVHRDVKPENILITRPLPPPSSGSSQNPALHLKLADFGLAMRLRQGEKAMGMYGSSVYMAPEVVCRRGCSTPVDIWSLGVILYTALCGYMPFWGSTEEDLFLRILRNNPDFEVSPWPTVSRQAIDLVRWMLSTDPAQRPTPLEALNHPWVQQHTADLRADVPRFNGSLAVIPPSQVVPEVASESPGATSTPVGSARKVSVPSGSSSSLAVSTTTEQSDDPAGRVDSFKSSASGKESGKRRPAANSQAGTADLEDDGVVLASPSSSISVRSSGQGKTKPSTGSSSSNSSGVTAGSSRRGGKDERSSDGDGQDATDVRVSAESGASTASTTEHAAIAASPGHGQASVQEDVVIVEEDGSPEQLYSSPSSSKKYQVHAEQGSPMESEKQGVKRRANAGAPGSKRLEVDSLTGVGGQGVENLGLSPAPIPSLPASVGRSRSKGESVLRKTWNGDKDEGTSSVLPRSGSDKLNSPRAVMAGIKAGSGSDHLAAPVVASAPVDFLQKTPSVSELNAGLDKGVPAERTPRKKALGANAIGAIGEAAADASTPGRTGSGRALLSSPAPVTPEGGSAEVVWGTPLIAESPKKLAPLPPPRDLSKAVVEGGKSRDEGVQPAASPRYPAGDMQGAIAAARREAAAEAEQMQRQRAREVAARARGRSTAETQPPGRRVETGQDPEKSDPARKSPHIPPVTADVARNARQPVRDPRPKGEPVLLPGNSGAPNYPKRPADRRSSTPQRRQMEVQPQLQAQPQAQPQRRAPSPLPQGARPGSRAAPPRSSSPFRFLRLSSYGRRSAHRPYVQQDSRAAEPRPEQEGATPGGPSGSPEDMLKPPAQTTSPQLRSNSPGGRFASPQRRPTSPSLRLLSSRGSKEQRSGSSPFRQSPGISPTNSIDMSRQSGSPRKFLGFGGAAQKEGVPRSQTADAPLGPSGSPPAKAAESARPFSPRIRPMFSPLRRRQNSMSGNIPTVASSTPSLSDLPRRDLGGMFASFNRKPQTGSGTLAPTGDNRTAEEARPRSSGGLRVPRSSSADRAPAFMGGGVFKQSARQPGGSGRSDFAIPGISASSGPIRGKKSSKMSAKEQDVRSSQESGAGQGSNYVSPTSTLSSPVVTGCQEGPSGKLLAAPSPLLLPSSGKGSGRAVGVPTDFQDAAVLADNRPDSSHGDQQPERTLGLSLGASGGRSSSEPVMPSEQGAEFPQQGGAKGSAVGASAVEPEQDQQAEEVQGNESGPLTPGGEQSGPLLMPQSGTDFMGENQKSGELLGISAPGPIMDAIGQGEDGVIQSTSLAVARAGSLQNGPQGAFTAPEQWGEPSPGKLARDRFGEPALTATASMGRPHPITNGEPLQSPRAIRKRATLSTDIKAAQGAGEILEVSVSQATPDKKQTAPSKKKSPPTLEKVMSRGLVQGLPLVSPFRPSARSFMRSGSLNPNSVTGKGGPSPSPSPSKGTGNSTPKAARPSSPLRDRIMRFASPGRMRSASSSTPQTPTKGKAQ